MKTINRTTQMTIMPEGEPIFSERAITLTIDDEASGEYLKIAQHDDAAQPGELRINPEEWPDLRTAINAMMAEIAKHEITSIKADTSTGNYIVKIIAE